MNPRSSEAGFTLFEIVLGILVAAALFLTIAHLADTIAHVDSAARAGADARSTQALSDRVLRRALEDAGRGMPSAPNLGGVAVGVADGPDGSSADTLVTLRAEGDGVAVAARPCSGTTSLCVALVGNRASGFRAGDLVVVGTRGLGLGAYQVVAAPRVVYAPCGADCPERLVCANGAGALHTWFRVLGSVRTPGGASPAPCAQPYLADGSRCAEVVQPAAAPGPPLPLCRVGSPPAPFTELRLADRTAALGFLPPIARLLQGGGGTPRPAAVRVRASRFWIRTGADTLLVRQNGLDASGQWRAAVPVAALVDGLTVETFQPGAGWVRGLGISAADLLPSAGNPNFLWYATPAADARQPGFAFRRGYHTPGAVRVRVRYRALAAAGTPVHGVFSVVAATPSLLHGGAVDIR